MSLSSFNSTILDDQSSNITYATNGTGTLSQVWSRGVNTPAYQALWNNTESISYQIGSTATLSFYGDALEYWSNTNTDHGRCQLTLDDNDVGTISSYSPTLGSPVIIYSVRNLTLGDHTLKIRVKDAFGGCELDRFVVNATIPDTSGDKSHSTPQGAVIAGSLIGGMVLGGLIALGVWFYCHKRHSKRKETSRQRVLNEFKTASISITPWSVPEIANPANAAPSTASALANNGTQSFGSGKARIRNQTGNEAYTVATMPPMRPDSYSNGSITTSPPPVYGHRG